MCQSIFDSFLSEKGIGWGVENKEREQALNDAIREYGSFIFWYLNQLSSDHAFVDDVAQLFWVHVYEMKWSPLCCQ